jgi:hypothetical protein
VAKKLSCWVGRHSWTTRVDQGESYKVCSACGKTPGGGMKDQDARAHDHYPSMYDNP